MSLLSTQIDTLTAEELNIEMKEYLKRIAFLKEQYKRLVVELYDQEEYRNVDKAEGEYIHPVTFSHPNKDNVELTFLLAKHHYDQLKDLDHTAETFYIKVQELHSKLQTFRDRTLKNKPQKG